MHRFEEIFNKSKIDYFHNSTADLRSPYPEHLNALFGAELCRQAQQEIQQWPDYRTTPLLRLDGLARALGLGGIYYKDEGGRFGLGSFKSLGGAYEVLSLLQTEISARVGDKISLESLRNGEYANLVKDITVITATDGNHGRSVAWGAQQFGCKCIIYIHANVSESRKAAIEKYGALVVRIEGNYDESVLQATSDAAANGWFIVSDTTYEGYTDLPRYVMAGYTVMADEILSQLPEGLTPTHTFIQGGVGGLAGAVCGYLWQVMGSGRPRFVIVEPDRADCLFQTARHGRLTDVEVTEETIMAGLSCGRVSSLAWEILGLCVDDFLTIPDDLVAPTMRLLAAGVCDASPVVAGESAVAGLAALIAATRNPILVDSLGLDAHSQILLLGTEGATDPVIYEDLVGCAPGSITAG